MSETIKETLHFVEQMIEDDLAAGKNDKLVYTRFPPEPNGYLHIGHVKSIWLNFTLAEKYGGKTNLRFDDTNPVTEDTEYVEAIQKDIRWLGFNWEEPVRFASDYFETLYGYATALIKQGKAYVDDSTLDEIRQLRGSTSEPGKNSPFRDRSVEENLDQFARMRTGEFKDGEKVLRAKIDMASPNMLFRDPILYRILHTDHHRTGSDWPIYPMYDFAHGQSDYIEGITHSICTLEFEVHRPLYDWFLDILSEGDKVRPQQIEFARLNLNYTIMSKRWLKRLVEEGHVKGWDDPRMPTVSAMRRRGYPPLALRNFAERTGVARRDNVIDFALLEYSVREVLNSTAWRVMAVLDPIRLVITNYPEGQVEQLETENNPEDPSAGVRSLPFSREILIERSDFMEDPPKKYFRLAPGKDVRLKSAFIIRCDDVIRSDGGEVTELHCSYYPDSRSGQDTSGVKVKGTIHWVSTEHAVPAEIRQYDRLFLAEEPGTEKDKDLSELLNPDSLNIINGAMLEPSLAEARSDLHYQFMRKGYYYLDEDSQPGRLVFNQTVNLRDTWAKNKGK